MIGKWTVGMVLVLLWVAFLALGATLPMEMKNRTVCLNNIRQITLAMLQYAGEYDDEFPSVLAPKAKTTEPAQYRFARLLKLGYLNSPRVFRCPSTVSKGVPDRKGLDGDTLSKSTELSIARVYFKDGWASYGVDVGLNHVHAASRAMLADRPHRDYWGTGVNSPAAGKPGSNSENHAGMGQNVAYNDGHVRWHKTCKDDASIDPNIYGFNPEIKPADDSNIDFGKKR